MLVFTALFVLFVGATKNIFFATADDDSQARAFNFGPGPAALPLEVLQRASNALIDFEGTGIGIMEYTNLDSSAGTHPGIPKTKLQEMMVNTETKLRVAIAIPATYDVLFMHGGAVGQFSAIPLNFLGQEGACADYIDQGFWSKKSFAEALKYGDVQMIDTFSADREIPWDAWAQKTRPCAAYLHVVLSETVQGVELLTDPSPFTWTGPPIVLDATSTLLSRPIDVSAYGMIYASGGKNLPAGVAVVIIRKDFLDTTAKQAITPALMDYRANAGTLRPVASSFESRPNTPPVWGVYLLGEVLEHLQSAGGVMEQATNTAKRAKELYEIIDESNGFYINKHHPAVRSHMNVVFNLPTSVLEDQFLDEAEAAGFNFLWGHSSVGGIRVTAYNWITNEAVKAVADFMRSFAGRLNTNASEL